MDTCLIYSGEHSHFFVDNTFYFGVDINMKGLLDFDQLRFDLVKVNITP